jgi:hypothetical protein
MQSNLDQQPGTQEVEPAKVTLCYSGNLAQVYFDLHSRKITLNELNQAYPGMVDALVQHEGIGFVVAYEDDGEPVAFGKNGARNLHTGDVIGDDPLEPYGDVELRSWQVRRIADFTNAGDLMLNSTFYPDGTVAALEELIGNHGGLGGEQTDAFIFHPADMEIPETRNSQDFMAVLKARVGLPGPTPFPEILEEPVIDAWTLSAFGKGLSQVGKWLNYAWRALTLHRDAYWEIAQDAYMTGPALLITLLSQILQSLASQGQFDLVNILLRIVVWFVAAIMIFIATRLLRGSADFNSTLRVIGFAQSAHIFELLNFLPVVGPIARVMALLLTFFGVWIGTATANEFKGWRTILLPVIYIITIVVAVYFLVSIIEGTALTIEGLGADFGLDG